MKMKSRTHGIIDYLFVVFLWVSPAFFGLPDFTSQITYTLGAVHLILTLITDYEVGVFKWVPFRYHGWIELIVGLGLILISLYVGNVDGTLSQNFYFGVTVSVILLWFLTDYKSYHANRAETL
jgi:hypothetical protein